MPTFVRVRDALGHTYSVQEQEYHANPDAYDLLDEPAADRTGNPLPPEPAKKAAKTAAPKKRKGSHLSNNTDGQKATDNKES